LKEQHFSKSGIFIESSLAKALQEFTFSILGWQRKPFEVQMIRKSAEPLNLRAMFKVLRRDSSNLTVQLILRDSAYNQEDENRLSA